MKHNIEMPTFLQKSLNFNILVVKVCWNLITFDKTWLYPKCCCIRFDRFDTTLCWVLRNIFNWCSNGRCHTYNQMRSKSFIRLNLLFAGHRWIRGTCERWREHRGLPQLWLFPRAMVWRCVCATDGNFCFIRTFRKEVGSRFIDILLISVLCSW